MYLLGWAIEGNFYLAQKYEFKRQPMYSTIRFPRSLQKGDAIALVAPSRKISADELRFAEQRIERWGFRPVRAPGLFQEHHQMGGTPEARAESFNWALGNPEVRAIWAVRGGYGAVQMLPLVNWSLLEADPKWLCGYSDFTVLLSAAMRHGVAALHASMPINFEGNSEDCLQRTCDILCGKTNILCWNPIAEHAALQYFSGSVRGRLMGGNLSVLHSQRGTPNDLDPEGAILFIEDLDEYLYHIDRMAQNLKLGRWFERVSGVLIGGLTDMNDNAIPYGQTALEILRSAIPDSVPVAVDAPVGHLPANQPLIMGAEVELIIASDENILKYVE